MCWYLLSWGSCRCSCLCSSARSASRLLKPLLILVALASLAASGCSLLPALGAQEAYVGPGRVAEVREPATVKVWVRDAKSGEMKRAYVKVYQGWLVGPSEPSAPVSEVK